jgi:hypothetical protein
VSIIENGIFLLFFCCYIPRMQSAEPTGRQNDLKHAEQKNDRRSAVSKKTNFSRNMPKKKGQRRLQPSGGVSLKSGSSSRPEKRTQ